MRNIISFCIAILVLTIMFASCQSSKSDSNNNKQPAVETVEKGSVIDIDAVLAQSETLAGREIEIEGLCTHICRHGGRKIFLMGSDDRHILRIEAGDAGKFDPKCVNSIVRVKGTLKEERIDEAYLQRWESKLAAQIAEKHGEGEEGCGTEKRARGETANTPIRRIEQFRKRIASEQEKSGKDYLSFFHLSATSYEVAE